MLLQFTVCRCLIVRVFSYQFVGVINPALTGDCSLVSGSGHVWTVTMMVGLDSCLGLGRLWPSIPTADAREWTKWTWPTCTLRRRPWVDGVFDKMNWGCPVWDGLSRNPDQVKRLGWLGWLGSNMKYTGQNCTFRMIMNQWMKWAGPIDSHPISWGEPG